MSKVKVVFKNLDEIQQFVNIVDKYSFDMALEREELVFRPTSILAIIYLGICEEICLKISEDGAEELKGEIEQFIAA